MRIGVLCEHDMKSIEQDVNPFLRSEPTDKEELFGLRLNTRRSCEECDICAVVNVAASFCQCGKTPPHAGSDEVANAEHEVGRTDAAFNNRCVKLLEPLTMHMEYDPDVWQPRSDNWNKLRDVHNMYDIKILPRGVRDNLMDEMTIP